MKHLDQLNELIDRASSIAGSDYKLAQALKIPRGHVSQWRHGKRTATPEDQAQLAGLAGLDAQAWLVRATLQKHEGTEKGDRLMKVLGKALLATGATVASAGASAAAIFGSTAHNALTEVLTAYSTMYIM